MDEDMRADLSTASMTSLGKHEDVEEDEMEFYQQLERRGWKCGVHDPDFAEPLEGMLHLDRGLRYMLKLDCEDESLSLEHKKITEISAQPRELAGGCGVALNDSATGSVLCIVVTETEEERELFLRVMGRLHEDPRAFRRVEKKRASGCMPAGCMPRCGAPACVRRRKKRTSSTPDAAKATSSTAKAKDSKASEMGLEDARAYVQKAWAKALKMNSSTRSSSFGNLAMANMRRAGVANTVSQKAGDRLDAGSCSLLLRNLLSDEEAPGGGSRADLFQHVVEAGAVGFEDFWEVFVEVTLLVPLLKEASLQKNVSREGGSASVSLEKLLWFLVQVQDEERAVVEQVQERVKGLKEPDCDSSGRMTLIGLTRFLCSAANSIFRPQRSELYQDMNRPLSEYWISSSHHMHMDPMTECADVGFADEGPLEAVAATLRSGCKCIALAITLDSEEQELCALFQQHRAPLFEVLSLISKFAFENSEFPVLLVLWLGMLSPKMSKRLPAILQETLGERLWRKTSLDPKEMPSPMAAKEKVIVILAPATAQDPSLDPEPPAALGCSPSRPAEGDEHREEVLQAWQAASKEFAIWPGENCVSSLPDSTELRVGFIPCDELQETGTPKKHSLTLVYPMAPRSAPFNYNPAGAWATGVQLVALSFCGRVPDGARLVHAGRFSENRRCGYVRKRSGEAQGRLEIRAIAARALQVAGEEQRPLGPIVLAVSIWGVAADCARQVCRPVRPGPGGSVVTWDEAKAMEFPLTSGCTALLLLEVFELGQEGACRVGFFSAPVDGLRKGLRWVPLWGHGKGSEVQSSKYGPLAGLLVHVGATTGLLRV